MQYVLNYSGARFLSTENKITQFPGGFRLNLLTQGVVKGGGFVWGPLI